VSDVLPASEVLEKAVQRARWLGGKPAQAFIVHKQALDPLQGRAILQAELEHTIDAWFSEEAARRRRVLMQRLAEKQAKRG
jgi:hypothetical protein